MGDILTLAHPNWQRSCAVAYAMTSFPQWVPSIMASNCWMKAVQMTTRWR